jgi:hypothetical protein
VQLEGVKPSTNLVTNSERKEGNKCPCCDKLKFELRKAKLEISSYEEIIKILLDEEISPQSKLIKTDGYSSKEGSFYRVSKDGLIKASRVGNKSSNLIQVIPTANKFGVLTNLNDDGEAPSASIEGDISSRNFKNKNQKKIQGLKSSGAKRRRITLIGNSHVRNCTTDLQQNLDENYRVSGFTKPGAGMEEIVNTGRDDIQTLSNKDVVIVWGGANTISKNNTKVAINHLCKFVEEKKKVNLVIMKAPPRHDLMPSSCVNTEVMIFNRQMKKKMKIYHNVKLIDTDLDRTYFTRHGQHLNSSGKELISNKLSTVIKDLNVKKQLPPICMPWKEVSHLTVLNQNNLNELLDVDGTIDTHNDSSENPKKTIYLSSLTDCSKNLLKNVDTSCSIRNPNQLEGRHLVPGVMIFYGFKIKGVARHAKK